MFASSRFEEENARVAFKMATQPIQLAVMVTIGRIEVRGHPQRHDNPFVLIV